MSKLTSKQRLTPLMLIAAFLSFTEVVAGTGLIKTDGIIQVALTVFVIAFPTLTSTIFFLFLWHRPTHLYAPDEYSNSLQFTKSVVKPNDPHLKYEASEIASIKANTSPTIDNPSKRDVLLVIDVQNDFIDGVLAVDGAKDMIPAINQAIVAAHRAEFLIIFTRDWHPPNHSSFRICGGIHEMHCVAGSYGAELHSDLYTLTDHAIVDFGTSPNTPGYSPLENKTFRALVASDIINKIFITGIAFEYCVQACCLDLRKIGKNVIAVEPLIIKTDNDTMKAKFTWDTLETEGVTRSIDIPPELQNNHG